MAHKIRETKPIFIVGPPRCGTTALLRTLSCLDHCTVAISEPFRVHRTQNKNLIRDAFCFSEGYPGYKAWLLKRKRASVLDDLKLYRLNACYKETVRFHDYNDPVNRDILELVLSESCAMVGCIRHPVSVVNSVFYRFRSESTEFDMSDRYIMRIVGNLENYLRFCYAFEIPVVRYEDWVEDPKALDRLKEGLGSQLSSINFAEVEYFGIGDAKAERSAKPENASRNKVFADSFCSKIYNVSGKKLLEVYPNMRPV